MGTIQDKQTYNLKNYIKRLAERREALEERKEYILEMSIKNAERKKAAAAVPAEGGEITAGGGSVVLNGEMPTIAQYTGPDSYSDSLLGGALYQGGLRAKLAGTDKWNKDIIEQAGKAGVNPLLVKVIMATESGGTHKSTPNAYNCVGLMQVMGSLVTGMGLDWNKAKNDPVYNIYCGCKALVEKHEYAKSIIKNAGSNFRNFKARGYELKANGHGVAWLYNGFSMPKNGSSKVTSGGVVYANQVAAMYAGFGGRDARVDTIFTLDVLGAPAASNGGAASRQGASAGSAGAGAQALEMRTAAVSVAERVIERELLSDEESDFLLQRRLTYNVPIGKMKGRYYQPPKYSRLRYMEDRKTSVKFVEKAGFSPLSPLDFQHIGGPQENYYAPEAREVFLHLKDRLRYKQMIVTRGFDPHADTNNSSHAVGIAMDIHVATPEEAIRVADTAWLLGIRSIAIGPKFVHVDAGPEAVWGYGNMTVYRGPGTVKRGGIEHGYR